MNPTTTENEKPAVTIVAARIEEKKPARRAKWQQLAEEARGRISARHGWDRTLNADVQIAREIAAYPVTAKAFLRSAKGQQGKDPQSLRHRLLAEVRRSAPGKDIGIFPKGSSSKHVGIFGRFLSNVGKLFRK